MTISGEPCPICGLNCEEDVKRVWPDAFSKLHDGLSGRYSIYKNEPRSVGTFLGAGDSEPEAWHSAAQNPRVKEDLLFDRMGGQYFNWDEINRRIREAEKIGEARGFNACREMAARLIHRMVVGFEATKVTAPLVTPFKEIEEAIRNLKQPEGKSALVTRAFG